MKGSETFHSAEVSDLRAQNEELQEVIKYQEIQVQNSEYLRERNRMLEAQLADKTAEASSAYDALAALVGGGGPWTSNERQGLTNAASSSAYVRTPPNKRVGRPPRVFYPRPLLANIKLRPQTEVTHSKVLRCDQCKASMGICEEPGQPCTHCRTAGQMCTFNITDMINCRLKHLSD